VYSHRSNVIHSLMAISRTRWAHRLQIQCPPVVPLFHANSWDIAFSAPAMGTKLVDAGPKLDGASVYESWPARRPLARPVYRRSG